MNQNLCVERELSELESCFISSQPNMAATAIEIAGEVVEKHLFEAVTLCLKRYPSLRRNTWTPERPYRWREVSQPLPWRVVESDEWRETAQQELDIPFQVGTNSYLWRCTWVKPKTYTGKSTLLVMSDHAITDGMSMMIYINTLFHYYAALSTGDTIHVESLPAHLSVLDYQRNEVVLPGESQIVESLYQDAKAHNANWVSSLARPRQGDLKKANGFLCHVGNAEKLSQLVQTSRK